MTNASIADVLTTIGKLLELKGENVFRIRAYDRAAQTIASYPKELKDIYEQGGTDALKEIAGIGEDLSLKIEEMVTTGKLEYLEKLQKTVPEGLLQIMKIQGMGPKKTKLLWEKFKVETVEDLQKVVASGKLEKLKGWGEKSVENITKGIAVREELGRRLPLPKAKPLAEEIVAQLKTMKGVEQIEIAGSMRRARETVGDIDILVSAKNAAPIMEKFCTLPGVARILGQGETKSSVILKEGIQADLRVVDANAFGAALLYFTGSKEHNVHLRQMALEKGMTINEYGIHKGSAKEKGKLVASKTEQDIYKVVGLPWIPPELREDRGEITSAVDDALPELLKEEDLRGDLHMHSTFSDGDASMIDMAKAAKKKGFEYIAMTDHASTMGMVKGIKEKNIEEYLGAVEDARKAVAGIHILAGAEVDIGIDGSLYLSDKVLKKLDWVNISVHQHFNLTEAEQTARLLKAIAHPSVKVLAHPTARLLGERPGIPFDIQKVFAACAKHHVAVELNCSPERLDASDVLVRQAIEAGCMIILDSDAHDPAGLQYAYGVSQARRAWVQKKNVLNCKGWKEFCSF